jgi:signal transduction histidine kinase
MDAAAFLTKHRQEIVAEWISVADAITPRELSREELLDAAQEIIDSIVRALESEDLASYGKEAVIPTAVRSAKLTQVAKAHAAHRFVQRFSLKQVAAEYRALRANVTRRWLAERNDKQGAARELALFNAAVDASMASAIAWYDERLQHQRDELKAADQNKNEFLAVLGHELRNPLAPLRSGLDLLAQARDKPDVLETLRPMMERQFSHLSRLVDDLLDFARISRGDILLRTASMNLNSAIEAAIEQCAPSIAERGNELVVRLSASPLPVLGDFDRLTQVVSNLLTNPNKFMERGGRITVTSEARDDKAVATVADTGFGIPQEQLNRIFDLFTQVPEHRQRIGGGGLGIGLALARRLVEMHGGSIEARSPGLGHGSEFSFWLPLAREIATSDDGA